jgi:hypothetical protein
MNFNENKPKMKRNPLAYRILLHQIAGHEKAIALLKHIADELQSKRMHWN